MPRKPRDKPTHHASDFDLDVLTGDRDMFRWFLLSYLFGKPIQSAVAAQTWELFMIYDLDTPWDIVQASQWKLVQVLNEGRYTRYANVMSRALQTCCQQLLRDYEGSLMLMLENSANEEEFSKRLQQLFGVGPKTAEIVMSETQEFFARRVE